MADPRINVILGAKDDASKVVKGLRGQFETFKRDAMAGFGLGAGISVFGAAKQALGNVVDTIGDAITAASDLEESQSKVDQVFTDSADVIHDWASTSAEDFGLSETAALEAAGTFGNFIQALGNSEDEANNMSRSIVELAADLASFNNQDIDEVLVALRSGLAGEAEPMRRLGVSISAARIESNLLAKGVVNSKSEITDAMKVSERYAIIMDDTAKAQGDFKRTSDGLANSQRTLEARMSNAMAKLGGVVEPLFKSFVSFGADVIPVITESIDNLAGAFEDLSGILQPQKKLNDDINARILELVGNNEALAAAIIDNHDATEDWNRQLEESNRNLANRDIAERNLAGALIGTNDAEGNLITTMDRALEVHRQRADAVAEVNEETERLQSIQEQAESRIAAYNDQQAEARDLALAWGANTDSTAESTGDLLDNLTNLLQPLKDGVVAAADFAEEQRVAREAAEALGEAIEHVADVSFADVEQSANDAKDAIKAAFDDPIPSIEKLRREEERLARQRKRAMREGRFDIVAMIDQRKAEVQQQIGQRQMVNRHYRAEKAEQQARRGDMKLLREQYGLTKDKAEDVRQKLIATFGKGWKTKIDRSEINAAIRRVATLESGLKAIVGEWTVSVTTHTANKIPQPTGKKNRPHTGGVVAPGETAVIRQNEAVLTPASKTSIVPLDGPGAPRGSGGGGNVYLDGYLVGKVIDEYQGRQYGTASRVSNYRRTN